MLIIKELKLSNALLLIITICIIGINAEASVQDCEYELSRQVPTQVTKEQIVEQLSFKQRRFYRLKFHTKINNAVGLLHDIILKLNFDDINTVADGRADKAYSQESRSTFLDQGTFSHEQQTRFQLNFFAKNPLNFLNGFYSNIVSEVIHKAIRNQQVFLELEKLLSLIKDEYVNPYVVAERLVDLARGKVSADEVLLDRILRKPLLQITVGSEHLPIVGRPTLAQKVDIRKIPLLFVSVSYNNISLGHEMHNVLELDEAGSLSEKGLVSKIFPNDVGVSTIVWRASLMYKYTYGFDYVVNASISIQYPETDRNQDLMDFRFLSVEDLTSE